MTYSKIYFNHQVLFFLLVILMCVLPFNYFTSFSNFQICVTLILFFGLGIPHGALDVSIGKRLFEPKFGSWWSFVFILVYLLCVGGVVFCWIRFPLPSFCFFLGISAFHFGFSDRLNKKNWIGFLEGCSRGLLPITVPTYFYPDLFQEIVESSLSKVEAHTLLSIVQFFFYPDLVFLIVLIVYGFLPRDRFHLFFSRSNYLLMNSLELTYLLILFLSLKPFPAFLIYFCFLHSFRHILHVLEERNQLLDKNSIKWLIIQALPATVTTFLALTFSYFILEHEAIDLSVMFNLFFISLAALTFPHMILVEAAKK